MENVSDRPIKFSAPNVLPSARAEVRMTGGGHVETSSYWHSGYPPLMRYLLQSGEQVLLAKPSVVIVENVEDREQGPGTTNVVAEPGVYLVRYSLRLDNSERWSRGQDGVMYRSSPAKGEWTGRLSTGAVAIAATKKETELQYAAKRSNWLRLEAIVGILTAAVVARA